MTDQVISALDLLDIITKKNQTIEYMRNIVKAYTDTYTGIGTFLKEMEEDDDVPQEIEDDIVLCFDRLQALLTLYEDTKPENIDKTLAGYSSSQINKIGNNTLN
jgi:hypothetical protein